MLTPLPYHLAIRDLLREMDQNVWNWFGKQRLDPAGLESMKFDLLKSTYRLSRELTRALPEKLVSSLPSIEDIEAELSQDLPTEG